MVRSPAANVGTVGGGGGMNTKHAMLLCDMQRCLLLMEHENRCAERDERLGCWLTDHTEAIRKMDEEYAVARKALTELKEAEE